MNQPQPQGNANNWNTNAFDSFANAALNTGVNSNGGGNDMNNLVRDAGIKYARTMGESTFAKYMPGFIVMWRSLKYYFDLVAKVRRRVKVTSQSVTNVTRSARPTYPLVCAEGVVSLVECYS